MGDFAVTPGVLGKLPAPGDLCMAPGTRRWERPGDLGMAPGAVDEDLRMDPGDFAIAPDFFEETPGD